MDRLQAMTTFVAVVDSGGFASAARKLNQSPPVVTRAVAELEERLGLRLLTRTTRVVRVTEKQSLDLGLTAQVRLTRDAELRRDNGVDSPQRIWASVGWRY